MTDLSDWDFPVPNAVIALWLSMLEAIVAVGTFVFVIALLEQGEIIPALPLPSGMGIVFGGILVFTALFTLFRLEMLPGTGR